MLDLEPIKARLAAATAKGASLVDVDRFIGAAQDDVTALIIELDVYRGIVQDLESEVNKYLCKLNQADKVELKSIDLINRLENKIDRLEDAITWHKLNCKESRSEDEDLWEVLDAKH